MSEVKNYQANVDKMYTYLKAFFRGAGMKESMKALQYAREQHKEQTRKNGVPYIVHPLSMACYAAALGISDDITMATILLHDVPEDCNVPIEQLPFSDGVKQGGLGVLRHSRRRGRTFLRALPRGSAAPGGGGCGYHEPPQGRGQGQGGLRPAQL